MINRDLYLNQLIRNMWNGDIKVITGIRRCGKSVLLFDLFYEYLLKTDVKEEQILKFELDQRKYYKYRNPITLCKYVEEIVSVNEDKKYYLFIDEVQFTQRVIDKENGEIEITIYDMLNELKSYKNLDVYVTGSNSKMLSSDIATEFRGRATEIRVYPLSFAEYYSFVGGDKRDALDKYMLYGGMPHLLQIRDENDKKLYLGRLFEELYIKDLVERNNISKESVLKDLLDYIASQIGSLSNPTSIANAITSIRREKVDRETVSKYLDSLIDSFLVLLAKRYDIKGKTYFSYPNKYYYVDIGLRNARLNYRQFDKGHIMENIIYIELLRRGYSVDVGVVDERIDGKKKQREVDFVVNQGDRRVYIQSALIMDDDEKLISETKSLKLTKDFFKKVIIRADISHQFTDNDGILHCPLLDFLLDNINIV